MTSQPGGQREPGGQLTDEAEADDADRAAGLDVGLTQSLHGDRRDRAERRSLVADAVGDGDGQQARDDLHLGVAGRRGGHPHARA